MSDTETIFHIETVLKKRKKKSKVEYLIKWSGFDRVHNSWEPRAQLVADGNGPLLLEFDEAEATKKGRRKVSCCALCPRPRRALTPARCASAVCFLLPAQGRVEHAAASDEE